MSEPYLISSKVLKQHIRTAPTLDLCRGRPFMCYRETDVNLHYDMNDLRYIHPDLESINTNKRLNFIKSIGNMDPLKGFRIPTAQELRNFDRWDAKELEIPCNYLIEQARHLHKSIFELMENLDVVTNKGTLTSIGMLPFTRGPVFFEAIYCNGTAFIQPYQGLEKPSNLSLYEYTTRWIASTAENYLSNKPNKAIVDQNGRLIREHMYMPIIGTFYSSGLRNDPINFLSTSETDLVGNDPNVWETYDVKTMGWDKFIQKDHDYLTTSFRVRLQKVLDGAKAVPYAYYAYYDKIWSYNNTRSSIWHSPMNPIRQGYSFKITGVEICGQKTLDERVSRHVDPQRSLDVVHEFLNSVLWGFYETRLQSFILKAEYKKGHLNLTYEEKNLKLPKNFAMEIDD